MMFLNPIIAMLHNERLNRWHPVLFIELPLPGPYSADKPIRHKSKMHHTSGFDTRESALESTKQLAEQVKENAIGDVRFELAGDIEWDGDGIPAMVAFFG